MNPILYGTGQIEGITAVEAINGKENTVEVFYKGGGSEYVTYDPFIYISKDDPINKKFYNSTDITDLFGSNYYNRIVHSDNWSFIKWIQKNAESSYLPFLQSQWMIASGQTQFKGMEFDDPLRLYLDIEVYTSGDHDFPNSQRPEDRVIIITAHDNRGNDYLWRLDEFESESDMLATFVKDFRKINPDIIVLHNGFGFDLPYLRDRCLKHGVKFALGRDGSEPRTFDTSIKFAEKSDEYENFQIYGRHVLDTMFQAKSFDVYFRGLESYGLKYCADFLGGIGKERTYIKGEEISWYWDNKRDELLDYAMDDVYETRLLDKEWGQAIFEMAKMIPLPCQDTARYGTGNLIDQIFVRYYYNHLWSLPKADPQRSLKGGFAHTYRYGYCGEDSLYEDISALYPTLAELLGIQPRKDELKLFSTFVPLIKQLRYEAKYGGENAKDQILKRLLNTGAYGWLVWSFGMFNDYDEGERITTWGQKIIKRIVKESQLIGAEALKVDTDGALVTVPTEYRGNKDNETRFIKDVEKAVNGWLRKELDVKDGITLEHDGRYEKVILFDDKSYVLLDHDGNKKIKGNTLTGRSNEQFTIKFLNDCIDHVLNEQPEKMADEYTYWKELIEAKLMPVEMVTKRQTINMSMNEYNHKIAAGQNRIAQYEAALQAERDLLKGDVIETWVEEPEPVLKEYKTKEDEWVVPNKNAWEKIRVAKNYNGNIDVKHYLSRLDKSALKLLVVCGHEKFKEWFGVRIPKSQKFKLVQVYGLEKFASVYENFGWTQSYFDDLSEEDQLKFYELGLTLPE